MSVTEQVAQLEAKIAEQEKQIAKENAYNTEKRAELLSEIDRLTEELDEVREMTDQTRIELIYRERGVPYTIRHVEQSTPVSDAGDTELVVRGVTVMRFDASGRLKP